MCKFNAAEGRSCVVNVTFFDSRVIHLVPGYFRQTVFCIFHEEEIIWEKSGGGGGGRGIIHEESREVVCNLSFFRRRRFDRREKRRSVGFREPESKRVARESAYRAVVRPRSPAPLQFSVSFSHQTLGENRLRG